MNDKFYPKTTKQLLLEAKAMLIDHPNEPRLTLDLIDAALKVYDRTIQAAKQEGRNDVMEMWYSKEHEI